MARTVKCGLIQAHNQAPADSPIDKIKKANIDHQMKFVEDAAKQGVQMLCFQEIFTTPYFCAEQQTRWYEAVEKNSRRPNRQADAGRREAARNGHRRSDL
jgi:N-carbamoylputrescine amidase